jgi:hypothetical protein
MATLTYPQYVAVLKSGIYFPLIKLELLREDESVSDTFVKSPLIGSNLTISNQDAIRRSVTLNLDNTSLDFIPDPNNGTFWANSKFALYTGIADMNQNNIFFPQGVFVVGDPDVISDPKNGFTVTLKADDKFSLLNCQLGAIYQIPINNSILAEMRSLLTVCNDPKPPILEAVNDLNPYTMRWDASSDYKTIFKDLGNLFSRDIYYDETGVFKLETFQDVQTQEVLWDYTTSEVQYMGGTLTFYNSKIFNDISVISSNSNGLTYQGEATNNDLTSDTCVSAIGKRTFTIEDDTIWSNDLCNQRAAFELSQTIRMQKSISLNSLCLPHIDCNKAITITDPNLGLAKEHYSIQAVSYPLDMQSNMTLTCYKYSDTSDFIDLTTESSNVATTTS